MLLINLTVGGEGATCNLEVQKYSFISTCPLSYTLLERGQDAAGGLGGRIVSLLQSEFYTTD